MGLDMYFEATRREYNSYGPWDKAAGKSDTTNYPEDLKVLANYISVKNFKSSDLRERYQVGYFRKFNALHNYIVQKYANGEDDCREIYLGKEDIENLRDICGKISENHAEGARLLPTAEGFFFGSTMYDDWYYSDVNNALELFNLILETIDFEKWHISYQASW